MKAEDIEIISVRTDFPTKTFEIKVSGHEELFLVEADCFSSAIERLLRLENGYQLSHAVHTIRERFK